MRKILLLMAVAVALMFTACDKDKDKDQAPTDADFQFRIEQTNFDFKADNPPAGNLGDVPWCDTINTEFSYVKFIIDGIEYKTTVYYVDGMMLTQVIKLPNGLHLLTSFLVYDDYGTPGDESDDVLIRAAPLPGSLYWELMTYQLNIEFMVDPFVKTQIPIDVLCWEELYYEEFGFAWFQFHDVRIERQCWFGDICGYAAEDFEGSEYNFEFDMVAKFRVVISKQSPDKATNNWIPIREIEGDPDGDCTEVHWANRIAEYELFKFELYVYVPVAGPPGFDYVLMQTWISPNGEGVNTNTLPYPTDDGVVDFVVGDCQDDATPADYTYAPYPYPPNVTK